MANPSDAVSGPKSKRDPLSSGPGRPDVFAVARASSASRKGIAATAFKLAEAEYELRVQRNLLAKEIQDFESKGAAERELLAAAQKFFSSSSRLDQRKDKGTLAPDLPGASNSAPDLPHPQSQAQSPSKPISEAKRAKNKRKRENWLRNKAKKLRGPDPPKSPTSEAGNQTIGAFERLAEVETGGPS